jgi:tripartite-type tricarboxylate transporter receptor subunit TctC
MTIRPSRLQLALAVPLLCLLAPAAIAQAQTYPSKPIKLVLPYAQGGIIDYVGRTLAQKLSENIGQPVVAENRPGAGGILGTDSVARSAPDGYTLVLMDPAIVINPTLQADVPYDLFKQLQTVSIVLARRPRSRWSSAPSCRSTVCRARRLREIG